MLAELTAGDSAAAQRLLPLVYDELRSLAEAWLRRARPDQTLQATALVHEAYLRLVDQTNPDWRSRAHFMAVAAKAMRQILIDHARRRQSAKRGGGWGQITLDAVAEIATPDRLDLLALDEALRKLAALNERQASIVEMRFIAGLSVEETAGALGISPRTVKLDWRMARAWLSRELRKDQS